jgi:hypothetical protein
MNDLEHAVIAALREATKALAVGDEASASAPKLSERTKPTVADDIATMLEGLVTLLHHVDLDPVPRSAAGHSLHAVVQHMSAGAQLARRVATSSDLKETPDSALPETRNNIT